MAYATDATVERIIREIPHEGNRRHVRRYIRERKANGVRLSTLSTDAHHLRALAQFLQGKASEDVTREDIGDFANQRTGMRRWRSGGQELTREATLGNGTMSVRKTTVKAFYRWLRGTEEYPPEVRWLKNTRGRDADALPVESVLTRDELLRMIDAQHHPQHKAIIATLYDSGCRASEFTSLRVRDIVFDEYGAVVTLPKGAMGLKTGARRIRVLHCTPYLRDWLNAHPRRADLDAPLWHSFANRNWGDALTANSLFSLIKRAGKRAGLTKDVWPHLFRHSRATESPRKGGQRPRCATTLAGPEGARCRATTSISAARTTRRTCSAARARSRAAAPTSPPCSRARASAATRMPPPPTTARRRSAASRSPSRPPKSGSEPAKKLFSAPSPKTRSRSKG